MKVFPLVTHMSISRPIQVEKGYTYSMKITVLFKESPISQDVLETTEIDVDLYYRDPKDTIIEKLKSAIINYGKEKGYSVDTKDITIVAYK